MCGYGYNVTLSDVRVSIAIGNSQSSVYAKHQSAFHGLCPTVMRSLCFKHVTFVHCDQPILLCDLEFL
jgi:hypothetical protein